MSAKLTPRQQEILDFIRSTLELLGAPPTRAEICNAFGFASPNAAEEHLKALLPPLPEEAFVQMGDYVRFALKVAAHMGFSEIITGAFFGKAVKIAQGFGHTHASRGLADLKALGRWTLDLTGDAALAQAVAGANTARQALELLNAAGARQVVARVGDQMLAALRDYAGPGPQLIAIILDFAGQQLWRGESQGEMQNILVGDAHPTP